MLQASEGGSVSLGRSLYKVKAGGTPTPAPQVNVNPGGVPIMVPATSVLTDRISRTASSPSIRSSSIAKPGEVVLSKNTLVGLCLTALACGIVMTLAIDRGGHTRVTEHDATEHEGTSARESQTTATRPVPEAAPTPTVHAVTAAPAADPVVVKLPAVVDVASPPPPAARKPPRPGVPVKPAAVHKKPAFDLAAESTPAPSPASAPKKWVDPFEQ